MEGVRQNRVKWLELAESTQVTSPEPNSECVNEENSENNNVPKADETVENCSPTSETNCIEMGS